MRLLLETISNYMVSSLKIQVFGCFGGFMVFGFLIENRSMGNGYNHVSAKTFCLAEMWL
ncbi:hypothetical protein BREVNS_1735 [Brevinematales bacterium NS]|nr:hypothetical protein BREVNS_1735 [Brevinematales bacterium NS]